MGSDARTQTRRWFPGGLTPGVPWFPAAHLPGWGERPLVVGVIGGSGDPVALARRARREGADLVEARIDLWPGSRQGPATAAGLVRRMRSASRLPVIATVRHPRERSCRADRHRSHPRGVGRPLGERERMDIFRAVIGAADLVDVEIRSGIAAAVAGAAHRVGRGVILSFHEFRRTPSDGELARLVPAARRLGGDLLKVAARAWTREDVARLAAFARGAAFPSTVVIAMGSLGVSSRLDDRPLFTYGAAGERTAPGQMSLRVLRKRIATLAAR